MHQNIVHLHQNNHYRKSNLYLLFLPAIIYVFIIVFYLVTSGGINYNLSWSALSSNSGSAEAEKTILGKTNVDK
ncbi:hypothetical protein A2962_00860 [Candidatus Woesebacteria bacterium RIFCSPLOWO2_01_FULL_39_61]|uniref:Uncharacterized protein n=1 Tax=Candidatus Woesebacteria bacterium RIFCSPHIGHO2_02_FULL_39_13 TaxID=1802505 RepID=A0A1F7YWR8_9BACT|nr:MAG: hypothetical protein A2692_03665 [Candidatus Woesebacteria bacterium RIFCSPHIGHO2_01_FULL_39_95]OGM31792.1 MAG: hypothetical protein A3D01_05475 [Candidatus Woesebacteria bacterium RIFCSPHIGHO2_02_FULL_39_13]OGM36466.1 MAG: hypothetical protein A3E13_02355 [Candidatus Woesebacteria bacterium RIFCSPHIGHO2_12_FULL_40_20]OGM68757.1 MAG: hypothetical protein A2962_00860 [Candidatus Woesebacteria bacterium RIFCSPLOWO2_01_FULL_39_61]OGM75103.1 MAG: hypothetical protein A3H19_01850 [Candidatus